MKKKLKQRILYTANAGDARAILGRGGKAIRLTVDHKATLLEEQQRIKEAGGFIVNKRVCGMIAVTRSLGDVEMKELIISDPYVSETQLKPEDNVLVIACDGLFDVMSDQEVINFIKNETCPQKASSHLLKEAMKRKTTDNINLDQKSNIRPKFQCNI